ncbi:MAG: hypothetical protein QOJ29_3206 [Thermoleophilaceae bacterium]|nr:hypothetical protein [Thermoleophilaceae bacterium]
MSTNVQYLGSIKQDVGLTTGAKIIRSTGPGVPDKMFVTSGKNITIYNINDPANPVTMGTLKANVAWENEEVPTNGEVLAVASDFYSVGVPECVQAMKFTGCVQIFDVRDPANIKQVGVIPTANHTAECVLNCSYFYGRAGTIIDARDILKGRAPTVAGNWINEIKKSPTNPRGVDSKSCHHIREIRPGVLLTACQPFAVITVNPEDFPGASPEHPKVLYSGAAAKFVHSARWPRAGQDKFVLIGGEKNFKVTCKPSDPAGQTGNNSEFSTYSADKVLAGESTTFEGPIKQIVPENGTYTDGHAPAGELGCSVHWFQEHPTFHNGGLVALSEYENGVRFLQVTPSGDIIEKGYFVAAGSSSSSPKWAPDGKTLYSIDYHRGIDILRWNDTTTYVPNKKGKVKQGKVRGSVEPPLAALRAARRGEASLVAQLRAVGWFPGYCRLTSQS